MKGNRNILQIDVEDWFMDFDISTWHQYEDRVVESTDILLKILREKNVHATFFILGYIADLHPELIERIAADSHEIGSHGYSHRAVTQMTQDEFKADLSRSISVLRKLTGEKIHGYRAPFFTIMDKTAWAIRLLKKEGLEYDSSIFPVKTHLYGIPDAKLYPYHPSTDDIKENDPSERFYEFPLAVYRVPGTRYNVPVAGGFYLRFLPYSFIHHSIKQINRRGYPAICYIHPWELDAGQPRHNALRWYHYYNLSQTEKRLRKLVTDFRFSSTWDWMQYG
ncbi:MAG TPA: polysaccharide deacetylase family protein [Methanocella sp.]|nr:polysaccharide deacetylase family protein [Methanocella sp.]